MAARVFLLLLVVASAACLATARKMGPGEEVVEAANADELGTDAGRSLLQYGPPLFPEWGPQYPQPQYPQPQYPLPPQFPQYPGYPNYNRCRRNEIEVYTAWGPECIKRDAVFAPPPAAD